MNLFEIRSVPQLIVKSAPKEELRAEVQAEFRAVLHYLLGSTKGVTLHLWSEANASGAHVAYEISGDKNLALLDYMNHNGRLFRVGSCAAIPERESAPYKLQRAVDLLPVGAIDRIDEFGSLPILPPEATRFTNFDPSVMGQSSMSQVVLAPMTQLVAAFVRDRWTPTTAYLAPAPRTVTIKGNRDFAWRSTLGQLAREEGRISIRTRPLDQSDVLEDYALLCLQYIIGTHAQRLSGADLDSQTHILRDIAARKPLFEIEVSVSPNQRLKDAFLQDTDTEAFQMSPTALETALMRRSGANGARTPQRSTLQGPEQRHGAQNVVRNPARMYGGLIGLNQLCDLLAPPFTLTDALPGIHHFVPRPFQDPYIERIREASRITLGQAARGQPLDVPLKDFARHVFITGASGTGKTNTLYHLISQFHKVGVPVLIIDPAKRDFERLMDRLGRTSQTFDFKRRWIRFNPFLPPDNITLYAHSVVLAKALSMLFPTNAVAYEMLLSMVKKAYWNKLSARRPAEHPLTIEIFAQKTGRDLRENPALAPTFTEFLEGGLLDLQQSASSSSSNFIREALEHFERRWDNMRKSLLSIVFQPVDPKQSIMPLFESTALIELGEWFDKDEANAVFALIFSFLYETRLSGFQDQAGDAPLLHVAVLDEAHRIVPGESGSGDGQLVSAQDETSSLLSQMIAECRALGQGLIFAEQSASTIASSVLINSSTKVVHGVTYGRDKEFLKSALGLSDQETDYLSFIERGEALAISPLTYQPVLVRVPRAK